MMMRRRGGAAAASATAFAAEGDPFWATAPEEALRRLRSSGAGLSAADAGRRLADGGANVAVEDEHDGLGRLVLRQVASPLVLILVFGSLVALALREWIDAAVILGVVLASAGLGTVQEYRASTAVAALKRRLAITSRVLRDGTVATVPMREIVPGDVVVLSAGNLVPGDGIVLEASDFLVTEASLTGEPYPVEKRPGTCPADAPPGARTNAVFLGSSVRSGTARVLVVLTGRATAYGRISQRLRTAEPPTAFARGIAAFGTMLLRLMIVVVLAVIAANALLGRPAAESLLFAVALAVGLSPELLPAIITVTLAGGARAMARRGVIVRRLEAIENLGAIDVLCTDKTGTLTTGRVVLSSAVDPLGAPSGEVHRLAFLNAAFETGIENPLDNAILAASPALSTTGIIKVDEIPYDFERRRLTIVVTDPAEGGRHRIIVKGAFANVLSVCTTVGSEAEPLDGAWRARLLAAVEAEGTRGGRVLAVATALVEPRADYRRDDEEGLTLAGLLTFADPPKPDAAATIARLAALGIRAKIISGDIRFVCAHVAEAVGLDPSSLMTGERVARIPDAALRYLVPQTDVFAEVSPGDKERIVRALAAAEHVVGFLGDGINDAPALHAADVGISVDGAADVARESADIVLVEPDLGAIETGVALGRRTFANTVKYIAITLSANFGNMVSMALATPLLPFLPMLPKQILLNNFLSDLPSMAISLDRVDPEAVEAPHRWRTADLRRFMIVFGLASSALDLATFAALLLVFRVDEAAFQTTWFVVSLLTELAALLVLRSRRPLQRTRPSALLAGLAAAVAVATLMMPFTSSVAHLFGFVPLSPALLGVSIAIVGAYVVVNEVAKTFTFSGAIRPRPSTM